jgi:hypothetical protein
VNISRAVQHIYPEAIPSIDFVVINDGPTPVLRQGVDGRVRFFLRQLEEGEKEEIEGVHYRHAVDFNRLIEGFDYDIVERGPYIAVWNRSEPQPNEQELQAAWNAIKDIPVESTQLTDLERMNVLEKENEIIKAQNQALADRVEFIENFIVEKRL